MQILKFQYYRPERPETLDRKQEDQRLNYGFLTLKLDLKWHEIVNEAFFYQLALTIFQELSVFSYFFNILAKILGGIY